MPFTHRGRTSASRSPEEEHGPGRVGGRDRGRRRQHLRRPGGRLVRWRHPDWSGRSSRWWRTRRRWRL